jgi:hypothetical protein
MKFGAALVLRGADANQWAVFSTAARKDSDLCFLQ